MYRFANKSLPPIFSRYFSKISDTHSHYTRSLDNFDGTYARTNTRYFTLRCAGPSVWNNLPKSLRTLPNIALFKKEVRAYLLDNCHNYIVNALSKYGYYSLLYHN